jgi:hypothetical protein
MANDLDSRRQSSGAPAGVERNYDRRGNVSPPPAGLPKPNERVRPKSPEDVEWDQFVSQVEAEKRQRQQVEHEEKNESF